MKNAPRRITVPAALRQGFISGMSTLVATGSETSRKLCAARWHSTKASMTSALPSRRRDRSSVPVMDSVQRAGARPARMAAGAAGAARFRFPAGGGEDRQLLLELGARALHAAGLLRSTYQRLELVAAGAAGVFVNRHR